MSASVKNAINDHLTDGTFWFVWESNDDECLEESRLCKITGEEVVGVDFMLLALEVLLPSCRLSDTPEFVIARGEPACWRIERPSCLRTSISLKLSA